MSAQTLDEQIYQHHEDTIVERLNLARLAVEQGEATAEPAEPTAPPEQAPADASAVKDATTREAVLKALLDEVKEAYEAARTDVQYLLDRQEQATGARQFGAALPDGTKLGTVSLTGGSPAAVVTDDEAFTAWAREAFPAEARTRIVKDIQPAFVKRLLAEMTAAETTQVCNPETGEVHDVPGVQIKATRARSHSVRFTKTGRELVADAWRTGALAPLILPALAPAEQ
ncbi:hypothetical protein ACFYWN_12010 [Streptomyces sp. NPDC002917]|uniref:hypothetical protein n=1 Tax=Streptomyces sp. NPDC002917 TaxID=3364671 RepID=UPI00369B5CC0